MTLTDNDATITLTPPVNLRDLAGIPVADGVIANGFALRSDDLATITDDAADALLEGGLHSVIDLRTRDELLITGRGPLFDRLVNYHHIPLLSSIRDAHGQTDLDAAALAAVVPHSAMTQMPPMSEMYVRMFEHSAGALVSALAVMAHSPGASAFHCAAGKDRTGTLTAAILLILGASDETIIADYQATYRNLADITERTSPYMKQVMTQAGYDPEALREQLDATQETKRSEWAMADALRILRERYTDPLLPLRQAGLTTSLIDALHERAVMA
jgi:protein tyrosine/serine phosphatase